MALYRTFEEISLVINAHLKGIKDGTQNTFPQYADLFDANFFAVSDEQRYYITNLYYAIKDLMSVWYTSTYHVSEILKDKVALIEHRNYLHDPQDYDPALSIISKTIYSKYEKREAEDEDGRHVIIVESTFRTIPNIRQYSTFPSEEVEKIDRKNQKNIYKNLDTIFSKRIHGAPKRNFIYFIEWIANSVTFVIADDLPATINDKPINLLDVWNNKRNGQKRYAEVIEFLKEENVSIGSVFLIQVDDKLKWNAPAKYLSGFWRACLDAGCIIGKHTSTEVAQILGNTFSINPNSKYFEHASLYKNLNAKKLLEPFSNLPLH